MGKPIIIAHRGASAHARGNTLESFQKAVEFGADMIEFDVRRTKDGVLVAHHDLLIHGEPIHELTYREIERRLQPDHMHVPTIHEILDLAHGKVGIDVEIKEPGYENQIIELVLGRFEKDRFIVTSFNDFSLKTIKTRYPWIKTGLILGRPKPKPYVRTRLSELFPMKRCRAARADFLVPHARLLRFGFLDRAKRNNKPVYVWTINDQETMLKLLADTRVHGLLTDRPDAAVALRDRLTEKGRRLPPHERTPGAA